MKQSMQWALRGFVVLTLVAAIVGAIALNPIAGFAQAAEEATTAVTRTLGMGRGMHGGMFGSMFGGMFGFGARGQDDTPLAEALGITVDELDAAREKVFTDALAQAVEDGTITQEEADELLTQRALHSFLGERLQNAYSDAISAAVEEGIITQEQADAYLNDGFGHMGAFGGMMGKGMMGKGMMGHGMMGRGMGGMMDRGSWFGDEEMPGRGMMRTPRGQTTP